MTSAGVCPVCNAPLHPLADWCLNCTTKTRGIRIREEPVMSDNIRKVELQHQADPLAGPLTVTLTDEQTEELRQAIAVALGCLNTVEAAEAALRRDTVAIQLTRQALLILNRKLVPAELQQAQEEIEKVAAELGEP